MSGLSLLGQYHNSITEATGAAEDGTDRFNEDAARQYDTAHDVALDLLAAGGYHDLNMVTPSGGEIDEVHTLLTLAMHLAPNLVPFIQIAVEQIEPTQPAIDPELANRFNRL